MGPVMLILGFLGIMFSAWFHTSLVNWEREKISLPAQSARRALEANLECETKVMRDQFDRLISLVPSPAATFRQDSEELLKIFKPSFKDVESRWGIKYFFIIDPDCRIRLCLHDPALRGNIANQSTLRRALKTGQDAWGIDAGALGVFTFRYIRPIRDGGVIVGYWELGKPVAQIGRMLKRTLDVEVVTVFDKRLVDREIFENGRVHSDIAGDWNAFDGFVAIDTTLTNVPSKLAGQIDFAKADATENVFLIDDGNRWWSCYPITIRDVSGQCVAYMVVMRDITAERRMHWLLFGGIFASAIFMGIAVVVGFWIHLGRLQRRMVAALEMRREFERVLRESEERYRGLVQHINNGVAVYEAVDDGLDFVFKEFNIAGETIDKIDRVNVVGKRLTEVFPRVREFGLLDVLKKVWKTGQPEHFPVAMYSDSRIMGWRENYVYKLSTGEVVAVYRDVTAEKQAAESLRDSEQKFRTLAHMAPVGIYVADIDGKYIYINKTCHAMTGLSGDRLLGDCWIEIVHPEDRERVKLEWKRVVTTRGDCDMEYRLKVADGKEIWVRGIATPLLADNAQVIGFVGILVNITERKLAEVHQKVLNENLAHAQRLETIGRLAGGLAHDLNNMLMPILGYAEMLSDSLPQASPQRDQADKIIRVAHGARDIVHQLLAFARKQQMMLSSLNLNHVLREFEPILRRTLLENINVVFNLAESLGRIESDAVHLEQIILNLALNAQDAMPTGGILTIATGMYDIDKQHAALHPGASLGPHIVLEFSDTGVGMDPANIPLIFEPFFSTKKIGHGTGLGLASVHGIVQQLGGHIVVNSVVGRGSTFRIYFPMSNKPPRPDEARIQETNSTETTETILVVEDQASVRFLVNTMLTKLGYRVLEAEDAQAALAAAANCATPIHVLLTDVIMPGMNGRQLFEKLAADRPELKVLYMSGYPQDIIAKQGILGQDTNLIPKPFSMGELSRKLKRLLGGQSTQV